MTDDKLTHTSEGIPLRKSREEQKLDDLGILAEQSPEEAQRRAKAGLEERHEDGYHPIREQDIPLSDEAGEGRAKPREKRKDAERHAAVRQQTDVMGATSPRDETTR